MVHPCQNKQVRGSREVCNTRPKDIWSQFILKLSLFFSLFNNQFSQLDRRKTMKNRENLLVIRIKQGRPLTT